MAKLDLIGMVVQDMGESLAFYRLLGLDIPPEADTEVHVECVISPAFRIAWDTVELMESIYDEWPAPQGHRMTLAFACETPAEVDTLYTRITEAGYAEHRPPWDAFWGQRYAVVQDPDGNLVDLYANLE
jgi:uncharacterized glyoxalase superfamily protein PhnB